MNNDRMDELNEQLEDAYFALLLNRYAESEGKKQQEEYEKAAARNELPPVPEDLDAKCRDLIRKSSAKGRRKQLIQRTLPRIGRLAAVLLIVIGLCTTLVFSVDALRIPVMNFIIDQYGKFTSIGNNVYVPTTDPTDNSPSSAIDSPLAGLLPDNFELINYSLFDGNTMICSYQGPNNCVLSFSISNYDGGLNIDTEDAITDPINLLGHEGLLIDKGSKLSIVWLDTSSNKTYCITATRMTHGELWDLAVATAKYYCS